MKTPSRYEPVLNETYADLLEHYDVKGLPARVKKPRDKALAENGVLLAGRRVLAPLRNHVLHDLASLNRAIAALVRQVNRKPYADGTGKSWIACALAHKACLEGFQAKYLRVPRLLTDPRIAHGEGSIPKLYRDLARLDVLILDDWGPAPIDAARARDLLEILDDRFDRRSVIVTSQLPVPDWHQKIGEPTVADAILDRLVHGAIRFALHGTSMRADNAEAGT